MSFLQSAEFKVGLLVLVVATLIAYMSMKVSEDPSYVGKSQKAWFMLNNADGLIKNSSVKMAGIPVGIIKEIKLQDGQARIDMVIKSEVGMKVSAAIEIKAVGILGDKHIAIYPGAAGDPPLPEGGQILNVKDKGSIDGLISQVGDITSSISGVAKNLQEAVSDDGTRKHILGRIVSNIERLTNDLTQMTGDNKEKIGEIIDQVRDVTKTLDELVNEEGEYGLKANWKRSMKRIDATLKNVEEITEKVNKGEGTIGKLINDESTVDELNTAIEGVNGFLDTANKTQTALDFHTESLNHLGLVKSYVGLKIQPGLDRYYLLQIIDDPAGVIETTDNKLTTTGNTTESTEIKTYRNKMKFSAQFAKNFYDFTVRGGLIENTGGLGFDYFFFNQKLKFTLEAIEFSKLNLRVGAQYNFYKGIYVIGGLFDTFNKGGKYSSYLGAGLSLTNDDLKMLLSKVPF